MKYYTIYKTTNIINNKIYIGMHITNDLSDNYIGSGKVLNIAIKKYGIENFKKEILFIFNNFEDMVSKETELVNEEFVKRKDTYNLIIGGPGSFYYINEHGYGKQGIITFTNRFGGLWYTNGTEYKKIKENEKVPNGWYFISAKEYRKQKYGVRRAKNATFSTKGRTIYYNPKNPKELVYLLPEENIPLGWIKGSGRNINVRSKRFWYYNPETNECSQFELNKQPLNWIRGRKFKKNC